MNSLSPKMPKIENLDELKKQVDDLNQLLELSKTLMSEVSFDSLFFLIMKTVTHVMEADRSTLFLIDVVEKILWSKVAQGTGSHKIQVPLGVGLAGYVGQTGETLNIPDAYQDPRFNQAFDKKTGYRTRSILCMPIKDNKGVITGVIQVLNKLSGEPFTPRDEDLLEAFGGLAAMALSNARLYEETLNTKRYFENILQSIQSGVVAIELDGGIRSVNRYAEKILDIPSEEACGKPFQSILDNSPTAVEMIRHTQKENREELRFNLDFISRKGKEHVLNLNSNQLLDINGKTIGTLLVVEDVTAEKRMKSTLSRYMSAAVAEQVLGSDKLMHSRKEKVTILFSDIRSFTSISETHDATMVVALLNSYFERMINIVFKYEGTLDKFIGDALMAVFGAPIKHRNDSLRAVLVAMEMLEELDRFNQDRRNRGLTTIDIGIGICTGEVLAGNIGSDKRMEYTVIGDAVNLSSRLEGLTKNYPTKILISESVYQDLPRNFPVVPLGAVPVKGKKDDVPIFGIDYHFGSRNFDIAVLETV